MCLFFKHLQFEEMKWMSERWDEKLSVVRGCGGLLVLGDTWSDVNVLHCVWEGVGWKREREDGQIIPSAWWDWMLGLIDRLIIGGNGPENEWDSAFGLLLSWVVGLEGMLAAERHGLNVHGTWFHLCLIYSYMILAKWSNKKGRGGTPKRV